MLPSRASTHAAAPAAAAEPTGVTVTALTKRFVRNAPPVVDDVSFTAPAGTITTLLGPSGSGKSTVLRLIAGLERPDAGSISIGGKDVAALSPRDRGIGFVFQSYALFQHMTVRENVAFGLERRGIAAAEINRRVDELLATVELAGYGERQPRSLSGGQRQRVAFARALAIDPRVLLLDEPFAALDAGVRLSLRAWLRRFHERRASMGAPPVTTILVTHDQEEAMELSANIVVLSDGRVAQEGSPRDVYDRPAGPFVAAFVGGANLLPGRDGATTPSFVRPHEVKLRREEDTQPSPEDEPHVVLARVERLAFLGAHVKATLRLPDSAELVVELTKDELDGLALQEGDRVLADLRDAKLFVGDYAI